MTLPKTDSDTLNPPPHNDYSLNVSINGIGNGSPLGGSLGGTCPFGGVRGANGAPFQFSLPFNRVAMDAGLLLAPNAQGLAKEWQLGRNTEGLVVELLASLQIYLGAKRFHSRRYRAAMTMLLANLLQAYRFDAGLILPRHTWHKANDPRNPANITPRTLNACADFLAAAGLITLHIGRDNEYQHTASWAVADAQLIARYEQARIVLHDRAQLIELRAGKDAEQGRTLMLPIGAAKQKEIRRLAKPVESYNRTWLSHQATIQGRYLVPWARRIFNNGRLDMGGRFYAPYQTLPREDRAMIRIDGQVTVEHDYSGLHFNLLYSLEGLQFVGDPYALPGIDRGTAKQCGLRLLNSENLSAFKATVTRSSNREVQRIFVDYKAARANYDRLRAVGLYADEPRKPVCLDGFIEGVRPGTTGEAILQAYKERHEAVAHWFGAENVGLKLQNIDSEIMAAALNRLSGVPVLLVHDSIRCRRDDSHKVLKAMGDAYREITGMEIRIDSKAL